MELEPLQKGDKTNIENNPSDSSSDCENVESGEKRDSWGNRFEFLLAIIGFTVGIGSIWRFPILCARNGGGAFLIPFFFFLFICGGPLYYIEVSLGQFIGKSAGVAFELCPLFKGKMIHFYLVFESRNPFCNSDVFRINHSALHSYCVKKSFYFSNHEFLFSVITFLNYAVCFAKLTCFFFRITPGFSIITFF